MMFKYANDASSRQICAHLHVSRGMMIPLCLMLCLNMQMRHYLMVTFETLTDANLQNIKINT